MTYKIEGLFDPPTYTMTYVVWEPKTKECIIIDPVLDYDPAASIVSYEAVGRLLSFIEQNKLQPVMILETHAHADHMSSARHLQNHHFANTPIGIGAQICVVQQTFKDVFNFGDWFKTDGSQFDYLLNDGEEKTVGSLTFRVLFTPGHTPACCSYLFGHCVFTGDALFMPDYGTGRCDFPKGDARALYRSITEKLYTLPDETLVYVGHDYQPNGRPLAFCSTIGEEKEKNIQLNKNTTEEDFVKRRQARDAQLSAPRLLLPSIHVNIAAGELPPEESNGVRYLKIPLRFK